MSAYMRTEGEQIAAMSGLTEKYRALGKSNQGIRQLIIRSLPWIAPAVQTRWFRSQLPVADQRKRSGRIKHDDGEA